MRNPVSSAAQATPRLPKIPLMASGTPVSLDLPIPGDERLQRIFAGLTENPADNRTLEDWGKTVGATSRTLARLFRSETGMSFTQWRQQVRILEGLRRLAREEPVTAVALDLGYDSPSAFIAMFRKALGKTPAQYFKA
jgi:AraC-like DNA-binding protein